LAVARFISLVRHFVVEYAQPLARPSRGARMATDVRLQVPAFMGRRGMGGLIRGGL
ncbi:hypothetical protein, partial [Salmonella enterica]|uniref:hypothetical protein n=1 Tax=Salmonella enterica TaxID=28901 RepID=UPI00398C34EC